MQSASIFLFALIDKQKLEKLVHKLLESMSEHALNNNGKSYFIYIIGMSAMHTKECKRERKSERGSKRNEKRVKEKNIKQCHSAKD